MVAVLIVIAALAGVIAYLLTRPGSDEPSIVGTWRDTWQVSESGRGTYTGIGLSDAVEPDSGCLYRAGETEWRMTGTAPRYEGEERWVKGSNGQNCEFAWAKATFTLLDNGQTVEVCSTSPWNPSESPCRKLPRTDGRAT